MKLYLLLLLGTNYYTKGKFKFTMIQAINMNNEFKKVLHRMLTHPNAYTQTQTQMAKMGNEGYLSLSISR